MSQVAQVWVAYATPDQQWHVAVAFQQGMTVLDAIQQSGLAIAKTLPEPLMLGILVYELSRNMYYKQVIGLRFIVL